MTRTNVIKCYRDHESIFDTNHMLHESTPNFFSHTHTQQKQKIKPNYILFSFYFFVICHVTRTNVIKCYRDHKSNFDTHHM